MQFTIEDWLAAHVTLGNFAMMDTTIVDIGAYKGDFTKQMFSKIDNLREAILFEANKYNFQALQSNFAEEFPCRLVNCAVGDREDSVTFYCDHDQATGSILPYNCCAQQADNIDSYEVTLRTLDQYLAECPPSEKISVIKIDTQGNDLNVLRGAQKTLLTYQPWLVVELIYVPLYENQNQPIEIMAWLREQGYALAGLFNVHYSSNHLLSFADGIFIPQEIMHSFHPSFYTNELQPSLITENQMLLATCEERLQLINQLHHNMAELQKPALTITSRARRRIAQFWPF